jgi:hypothetical protein
MSFSQKCVVLLLAVVLFGGAGYFAHIVFRPAGIERYESIPWVTYVHPNVKKLKQSQALVGEGKLDEARGILVKALITAPKSPVTRELRDLLGDVNTQIFFSNEPSLRKTEYVVKSGDALSSEQTSNSRDADRPPRGIAMQNDDITEIGLLIRRGTPVTIVLDRPQQ